MIKIRTAIQSYLKTIHPRVYFQDVPENAQFPYVVYDITSILDSGEEFEAAAIDIDGWDAPSNSDTTALETLMDNINKALNKKTLTAEDMAVTFYLDRKIPLDDKDNRIKRRKYIYQARLFGRS